VLTSCFATRPALLTQSEADGWTQHERLGIEDPFETSYDIAHVVKSAQMLFIHKEFLVRCVPPV
jgi:hypothetical protein